MSASKEPAAQAGRANRRAHRAEQRINPQVRRDILVFTGFIAAGFILSVNLDVVGLLYALGAAVRRTCRLPKFFGTVIFACVGLTLYVITRYSAHVRDLKARLQTEERARRVAMHDQLTGPPNRRHLKGVLNWLLSENDGTRKLGVVMINLDRFQGVQRCERPSAGR